MPQRFRVHQKKLTLKRVKLHSPDDIHMYKRENTKLQFIVLVIVYLTRRKYVILWRCRVPPYIKM